MANDPNRENPMLKRLAGPALVLLVALTAVMPVKAQDADDFAAAAGAYYLASEMDVPSHIIGNYNPEAMTIRQSSRAGTDLRIEYRQGGLYECRVVAAITLATMAKEQQGMNAMIYCPRHRIDVGAEILYGELQSFHLIQYRRSDGTVVYRR